MSPLHAAAREAEILTRAAADAAAKIPDALQRFLRASRQQVHSSRALTRAATQTCEQSETRPHVSKPERKQ